jgi:hypothetical protein
MSSYTDTNPARVYNQPYAVAKGIDGTSRHLIAGLRAVHITPWLQEVELSDVIEAWWAAQMSKPEVTP